MLLGRCPCAGDLPMLLELASTAMCSTSEITKRSHPNCFIPALTTSYILARLRLEDRSSLLCLTLSFHAGKENLAVPLNNENRVRALNSDRTQILREASVQTLLCTPSPQRSISMSSTGCVVHLMDYMRLGQCSPQIPYLFSSAYAPPSAVDSSSCSKPSTAKLGLHTRLDVDIGLLDDLYTVSHD